MKTLYIERKEGVDPNQCLAKYHRITKMRKNDEVYTINGEDRTFFSVSVDALPNDLMKICNRIYSEFGMLTMYSGLVDKTRIDGVVRKGNFIVYNGEEYILETELYDDRCKLSFPFITQRRINRKIRFKPLNISLPTDLETIERHINSLYVLEGKKKSKMDYTREIITPITIATAIYPKQLIWKFSNIPQEVMALLKAMQKQRVLTNNEVPAYFVMSETEMEHLELDLYIGTFLERVEEHIRPVKFILSPTTQRPSAPMHRSRMQDGVANHIENAESITDIGNISEEVRRVADQMLGSGDKTISFSRGSGGVNIKFEKKRD